VNLYAFVSNNGVDTTDLLGLCPQPKKVSISIDDGPLPVNGKMRALLRQHYITTTFFVVGRQVKAQEGDVKAIVADGHGLANHTWSHPNLRAVSFDKVKEQLMSTENEVQRVAGRSMKPHWRPPYGNINDNVMRATRSIGYTQMWLWDVDSLDWKYKSATQSIINQVKKDLRQCKKDVCHMLFHDLPGTHTALGRLIPMLKNENYEFVPFKL
jgi:peptidoglycan-N-acetylglucosamine deacetylase